MDNSGIIDDLGDDLNVNENNLENILEEEEDDKFEKNNKELNDKKNLQNENDKDKDFESENDYKNKFGNFKEMEYNNNQLKDDIKTKDNLIKIDLDYLSNIYKNEGINIMIEKLHKCEKMDIDE